MRKRSLLSATALAFVLAGQGSADCVVPMEGSQEVPAVASGGTATCTVTINTATNTVTVSGTYSGLNGNSTVAHIHGPAPAGVNGGVILGLSLTGNKNGTISGAGVLSASNLANLQSGLTYLNLHSTTSPGGELRGQIVCTLPSPVVTSRNGTMINPNTFVSTSAPQIGASWTSTITPPPGEVTVVAFFVGGPGGFILPSGELLCSPPRIGADVAIGSHSIALPNDCSLLGLVICCQGATFKPGSLTLTNAIDILIGT